MSRLWRFMLPVALLLLGAAAVYAAGRGLFDTFRLDGALVQAPGQTTIELKEPGKYTVWIQNRATIEGKLQTFPLDLPPGITVEIREQGSQELLPLSSDTSATLTINQTERRSFASINVFQPGPVTVSVTGLAQPRLFYVAKAGSLKTIFMFMSMGATGLCLLLAGLVVGIYFLLRSEPPQYHTLHPVNR